MDDKKFLNMNEVQAIWYNIQMALDDKENFELLRDVAEHNAIFINPQGVQQVRDARENTFEVKSEDFDNMLEDMFGRKISEDKIPVEKILKKENNRNKIDPYLNMELDDIKFIPYEK